MDITQARALTARLAERIATNTGDEAPSMLTEDVADFLSPQRAEREKQRFFRETPQIVGFAGELAEPHSWLTADVAGVPVLVTRDGDGGLHAMLNACAHRGARVATGRGTGRRFTCRSHGWTFDGCGALVARPRAECFDAPDERTHLTRLPVSDRSGLIVVGLDPAMPQSVVETHLAEIEPQLAGFDFRAMRALRTHRFGVRANWKLVAALSYESYHFATLHRDTVATWFAPNAVHDFFGRHSRWAFARRGTEQLLQQDRATWPESVPGAVSHALFPGTVLITTPDDAQIIRDRRRVRQQVADPRAVETDDVGHRACSCAGYDLFLGCRIGAADQVDLDAGVRSFELVHQRAEGALGQFGLPPLGKLKGDRFT